MAQESDPIAGDHAEPEIVTLRAAIAGYRGHHHVVSGRLANIEAAAADFLRVLQEAHSATPPAIRAVIQEIEQRL